MIVLPFSAPDARRAAVLDQGQHAVAGGFRIIRTAVLDAGRQHHEHVVREAVQFGQHVAGRAREEVERQCRRNGSRQTDGGHDQRLADRAGHLVQRALARHADRQQRVVDAPDGAEQADEGRARRNGGQEGLAVFHAAAVAFDRALQCAGQEFVGAAGGDEAARTGLAVAQGFDRAESLMNKVRKRIGHAIRPHVARHVFQGGGVPEAVEKTAAGAALAHGDDALEHDEEPCADGRKRHQHDDRDRNPVSVRQEVRKAK
jgi:hypothetical protein